MTMEWKRFSISIIVILVICMTPFAASGQTAIPYAEEAWESEKLTDYIFDKWGLEVADIDQDGDLEILAMASGNIICVYSATDFTFVENITIPSSGGYFTISYDTIEVAQADGDPALEIICYSGALSGGFVVIDASTKLVEWELTSFNLDNIAVADIDGDGMSEIITVGDNVTVHDVDTQTIQGSSVDITYIAITRDIEVADVIAGGNKEIVVLVDEFYDDGRLFIIDSQTLDIKLNKTLNGSFTCIELADVDSDGDMEIIVGEGGITGMSYHGYVYIYDSAGTLEWESEDLGRAVHSIEVADLDNDGNKEIVITSDRLEIWNAGNKTSIWSTSNTLIDVGEEDALVLADLDDDGNLDILTRATSYSANNRVLAYKVNGFVLPDIVDDDTSDDDDDDTDGDDTGDGDNSDDEDGFLGLGNDLTLIMILMFAGIGIIMPMVSRKRK